jgi:hypothetical protein
LRAILGVPLVPDWQRFHADQSDVAARALGGSYATAVRAGREWTVDQILAEATAATTDGGVDADPAPHA